MHISPALTDKLRRDVTGDKEVLRDWDFPFIQRCLEASTRMVYCVAFDCNANSSKNKVACSWFKFLKEPTLFLKSKSQADETQPALFPSRKLVPTAIWIRKDISPVLSWC